MHYQNCRTYALGGITLGVSADLPILDTTYHSKIRKFEVYGYDTAQTSLHHHFSLPADSAQLTGSPLYDSPPWKIFRQDGLYHYYQGRNDHGHFQVSQFGRFTSNHARGEIFNATPEVFLHGENDAITLFPTDQILFARLLAECEGCILHSAGMIIGNQGFVFAGHSNAGKSTIVSLLRPYGEILCDDRNIVRRLPEGWRLYGTWSHGDIPDVSSASAPLRAILLLEQAGENRLISIKDRREIIQKLLFLLIKPLVTVDWWEKTLDLVSLIAREVPVYQLRFQKSERIIDTLEPLLR